MVGTSSYDHAVFLVRKGKDDIALEFKQNIVHWNCEIFRVDLNLMIHRKTPDTGSLFVHISEIAERNVFLLSGNLD